MAINRISSGAFTSGTGALTVPVAAGYAEGDVFLLFVNSANQAVATPAGGWTEVANSPQSTGTAAAAGGVLIAAFWKICGASESAVSVADTGSYTAAQIHLFTGCDTTNPIHVTAGSVQASAATAWTLPSVTTTINDTLVVLAIGLDRDLGSTTTVSGWTNANLGTITEQTDTTVNAGAGGGLGIATADYPTAGTTGTTEVTAATSTTAAFLTIALRGKVLLETSGTSVSTALAALTTVPVGAELVSSKTGVDTVTLDSWVEAGDLAIIMAFNEAGTTVPELPVGVLGNWTARTMSTSSDWRSITYGNGTFVAISNTTGTIAASSSDGITWTARTLPTSSAWRSVTYGNGTFVAVAQGPSTAAASSSDGITWTARTLPTSANWYAIAYGDGTFVAVANASTTAASSSDGITWTARTMSVSSDWTSITYGNGTFVAVAAGPSTTAASSSNGITWTTRTIHNGDWYSVAYGNGTFVAVSGYFTGDDTAATSTNGITWTARTMPTNSYSWISVAFGDGVFVALSHNSSQGATSVDGITWTTKNITSSGAWYGLAYGHPRFVAAANGTAAASLAFPVPTSHDASSGTAVASRLASKVLTAGGVQTIGPFTGATSVACNVYRNVDPSAPIGNVAVTGGTGTTVTLPAVTTNVDDFVVCLAGHQSTDVYWPSGVEFAARLQTMHATGNWFDVAYGNGTFVATSSSPSANAASSPDGVTWTARTMPSSSYWYRVAFGNGVFVVVSGTATTVAASSTDGFTWTARTLPSSSNWKTVAYGNGVFLAIAYVSTAAATSPDGITWTARAMPSDAAWQAAVFGNGVFVAVTWSSSNAATSPDGITWTPRTMPLSGYMDITFGNGIFVAISDASNLVSTSPDGITWTLRTLPSTSAWTSVEYGGGMFFAVSANSASAATSTDGITWVARTIPSANWRGLAWWPAGFVTAAFNSSTALTIEANPPGLPLRRAQSIDATDAIVVYDSAGAVP